MAANERLSELAIGNIEKMTNIAYKQGTRIMFPQMVFTKRVQTLSSRTGADLCNNRIFFGMMRWQPPFRSLRSSQRRRYHSYPAFGVRSIRSYQSLLAGGRTRRLVDIIHFLLFLHHAFYTPLRSKSIWLRN